MQYYLPVQARSVCLRWIKFHFSGCRFYCCFCCFYWRCLGLSLGWDHGPWAWAWSLGFGLCMRSDAIKQPFPVYALWVSASSGNNNGEHRSCRSLIVVGRAAAAVALVIVRAFVGNALLLFWLAHSHGCECESGCGCGCGALAVVSVGALHHL